MKFGKYLAARQLELPEYAGHFINYKALKKLINKLINELIANNNPNESLQDKKGSFFFQLERELEKVNSFYLEKEKNLKIRLDILIAKKNKALNEGRLNNVSKNSITYVSLYDGFKKFSKDLDRLEQFVELNESGFTKVLKKWDKRSKSRTKELYLTTAVNVQPVFHREQIIDLSDLVANNLMELEAQAEGDGYVRYEKKDSDSGTPTIPSAILATSVLTDDATTTEMVHDRVSDELYTDFYEITLQNTNLNKEEQQAKLKEWSSSIISKLSDQSKKFTLSKVFVLLIANPQITDESLALFYNFFEEYIALDMVDDLNDRTCLHEVSACKAGRNEILEIVLNNSTQLDVIRKDVTGKTCLHYVTENGRDDLLLLILNKFPAKLISENGEPLIVDAKMIDDNPNMFSPASLSSFVSNKTEAEKDIKPQKKKKNLEPPSIFDFTDNESISPLLMAIIHNYPSSVKILLEYGANGFPSQDDLKPKYLPLNVACKSGNFEIVEILLTQFGSPEEATAKHLLTQSSQTNAEGLLPLHIVASTGHTDIVPLLLRYGADINQVDKLNKWSAIFYSVVKGYPKMTQTLIQYGANFQLKDDDGFDPLYYAIWEGNVNVLNVLIESLKKKYLEEKAKRDSMPPAPPMLNPPPSVRLEASSNILTPTFDLLSSVDMIPDLSLPPPIIPLRKYGHNFLEKKIFLKLSFYTSRNSIQLNQDTFLTSIPGRVTVSCEKNDLIPRNVMLPVLDNDKTITFQTDTFDDFCIDFELFPTFGTRLVAKATLSAAILRSSFPGSGSKLGGDIEIPLFDVRLRNIGSLKFNYEIVYPYSGVPLEISMYDTYWKSSSAAAAAAVAAAAGNSSGNGIINTISNGKQEPPVKSISFVTASSLSGEYFRVHVCLASDGTPIVCPLWQIDIGSGVSMSVSSFGFDQIKKLVYKDDAAYQKYCELLTQFENLNDLSAINEFDKILSKLYIPLSDFLQLINVDISLNLEIFFPSTYEMKYLDTKGYSISSHNLLAKCTSKDLKPLTDNSLNNFIDLILTDIFHHVRTLRTHNKNRSLILSSDNPTVCTILNWKQPNYPVFYNLNGIKFSKEMHQFYPCTANGFSIKPHMILPEVNEITSELNNTRQNLNIDNIDSINKESAEYLNGIEYQDQLTRSIKLAINFTTTNNLLGLMVPNQLLSICPELVKSIKSKGLILVAVKEKKKHSSTQDLEFLHQSPVLAAVTTTTTETSSPMVKASSGEMIIDEQLEQRDDDDVDDNGRTFSGVNLLSQSGAIGLTVLGNNVPIDDLTILTKFGNSAYSNTYSRGTGSSDGGSSSDDIDVNGLRFNDILSFRDAIDM